MSTIEMRLTDESLEELCQGGPEHGPELARLIREDVAEFDKFMRSLGSPEGGPLSGFERTIVQTYAYWKLTKARRTQELPRLKVVGDLAPGVPAPG